MKGIAVRAWRKNSLPLWRCTFAVNCNEHSLYWDGRQSNGGYIQARVPIFLIRRGRRCGTTRLYPPGRQGNGHGKIEKPKQGGASNTALCREVPPHSERKSRSLVGGCFLDSVWIGQVKGWIAKRKLASERVELSEMMEYPSIKQGETELLPSS